MFDFLYHLQVDEALQVLREFEQSDAAEAAAQGASA